MASTNVCVSASAIDWTSWRFTIESPTVWLSASAYDAGGRTSRGWSWGTCITALWSGDFGDSTCWPPFRSFSGSATGNCKGGMTSSPSSKSACMGICGPWTASFSWRSNFFMTSNLMSKEVAPSSRASRTVFATLYRWYLWSDLPDLLHASSKVTASSKSSSTVGMERLFFSLLNRLPAVQQAWRLQPPQSPTTVYK